MAEQIEIILAMGPDGTLQAAVPDGVSFEQAGAALKRLFAQLGVDNLPVRMIGQPEQHRHDPPQQRARIDGVSFASRNRS